MAGSLDGNGQYFQYVHPSTIPSVKKVSIRKRKWRRRKRKAKQTIVNRGISPISPRFITKLKYADEWVGPSSLGVPNNYIFNLNSLFDPNRTGTGHQPYGYDQIAALYDYYRVYAVSYCIEVTGNTATSTPRLTVLPFDGLPSSGTRTLDMEYSRAITKEGSVGNCKVMIRGRISLPNLRGQTRQEYIADDGNYAGTGASPSHVLSLNCIVCHPDPATTLDFQARVLLVYHCEFWDPVVLGQS